MRDEEVRERTVERFLECEAKRAEVRAAALADGKSVNEARKIAHETAKEHWNAWAGKLLAERKALEDSGAWASEARFGILEPKNSETRAWLEEAETSFYRCLLLGDAGTQEAPGDDKGVSEAPRLPVRLVAVEGGIIDFRGFIFPGLGSVRSFV
jgi:hypothetical protein